MSLVEYRSWRRFRERRGSFHLGMRFERGIGLLAAILANQNRDLKTRPEPFSPDDFTPHADRVGIALEQALESWV